MKSSAKPEVQLVLDACIKGGITHVVISPGSRNAPLSVAFDEHPAFTTFVIPDERVAAFYALGMALQTERPVAIACTSGSAPLNYFPAVAEAYYQGIPLVVLTADRPEEWVDQGDGQTIVQKNMYGSHVLASAQLNPIHSESQRWLFERQCAEVIQKANGNQKGPVHLNIPFSEPLYQTTSDVQEIRQWIRHAEGKVKLSASETDQLQQLWNGSARKLIICGQMGENPRLQKVLSALAAADASVAVLVEHTSNLKDKRFVQCIDRSLNAIKEEALADYHPDLILSLGGAVISKRIKTFLRNAPEARTIRVGAGFPFMDTFQSLVFTTEALADEVIALCAELAPEVPVSLFGTRWNQLDLVSGIHHEEWMPSCPFSDLKAMEIMLDSVPEQAHLHLANSSIIRYALLFDPVASITYRCNRGTSGIDGSTSTACGAALMQPLNWHVLISGDMSFFYDSNAFWTLHKPSNLRIFVLNNGGGDIFNIIPGPDSTPQKDRFFVAKHDFSAAHICKAYGVEYFSASSESEITAQLEHFFAYEENGAPKLMEIHTQQIANSDILKRYFAEIKK